MPGYVREPRCNCAPISRSNSNKDEYRLAACFFIASFLFPLNVYPYETIEHSLNADDGTGVLIVNNRYTYN